MIWSLSDGAVLASGGIVRGTSRAAEYLRSSLADGNEVHVLPIPAGAVQVHVGSDFLLHLLAKQVAYALRLEVETAYVPDPSDAPPNVRSILEAYKPDTGATDRVY